MFLSIDIGGTKTLLALFSYRGFCLKRLRFPTTANSDVYLSDLKANLERLIDSSRLRKKILALTVAIPGKIVIAKNSYTFLCPNIPWSEINLCETLKNLFDCKIFFANDANLATLYETSRLEPSLRLKKVIYLTFSTGIGGGISDHGHLLPRSDNFEPGHKKYLFQPTHTSPSHTNPMSQNTSTPQPAEWEDLASARALTELYHSKLTDLSLTPKIKADIVSRLTLGLTDIIKKESPVAIIVGGPLGLIFRQLKPNLISALNLPLQAPQTPLSRVLATNTIPTLLPAKKPTESVIYGAYLYSKENYNK